MWTLENIDVAIKTSEKYDTTYNLFRSDMAPQVETYLLSICDDVCYHPDKKKTVDFMGPDWTIRVKD